MTLRGILIFANVVDNLVCFIRFEDAVTNRLLVLDRGYEHLVVQAFLDAVNGFEELQKQLQGRVLPLERDGLQFARVDTRGVSVL